MAAAEQPGALARVLEAFVAGVFRREHHAPHLARAERIDRDRRRQRAVDPARQAEDHAGEAIAVDVIAQADHHRAVNVGGKLIELMPATRFAAPAVGATRPVGQQEVLVPVGHLDHDLAVGMHNEGGAVEHELVLAADAVQEHQRQAGAGRPRPRQPLARLVLVELIRAGVRHDEQLGAELGEMGADRLQPHVLAHRQAKLDPAPLDRARQGPRREDALFVEGAVIWEFVLEGAADDLAAIGQQHGVEVLAVLVGDGADQQRRAGLDRRRDQVNGAFMNAPHELGLEHQVFGRVADQLQLRTDEEIRTFRRRLAPHREHRLGIALEVADALVHLRERNAKAVGPFGGHAGDLATILKRAILRLPQDMPLRGRQAPVMASRPLGKHT